MPQELLFRAASAARVMARTWLQLSSPVAMASLVRGSVRSARATLTRSRAVTLSRRVRYASHPAQEAKPSRFHPSRRSNSAMRVRSR